MRLAASGSFSRKSLLEWLSVSLVLMTLGGYLAYSLYLDHQRIEAQEGERLLDQNQLIAENLGRQLSAINLALASVQGEFPEWRRQKDGWKLATRHLQALKNAMPGVITLFILDAEGRVFSADKPGLVGRNFAQREYFQTAQRQPNPATLYLSPPFMTALDHFTMNLTRVLPGPGTRFGGIVVAGLDPEAFKVLLASALYRRDMRATLIHGDGTLFLTVPDKLGLIGADMAKPGSFFSQHAQSGRKASLFKGTSFALGDERLVAMLTIQPQALALDKPLVVAIGRDLTAIFVDWQGELYRQGGMFEAAVLFALLGTYLYQKRRCALDSARANYEAELKQTVEALRVSEERYRSLTRLSSDWYWEQDEQFRFVRLHGKLDQKTSIVNEAHVGKTRWEMGALNLNDADWAAHRAQLEAHEEFHDFEMLRRNKEGRLYWVSISGLPIFDAQGTFCGYRGVARDISERKFAEDDIKTLAFFDSLTQLPNRRLFNDRLSLALAASKRRVRYGALMFLDLDNFKPLNDIHGHEAGDLLLIEVARRLSHCVREVDTVARFGGDEFAVILSELDSDFEVSELRAGFVAEKILAALAEPYVLTLMDSKGEQGSVTHRCSASIGVVLFMGEAASQKEILKRADIAMYQAKADGRNLIRFSQTPLV